MAFQFPPSPTAGQRVTNDDSNASYVWDGGKWTAAPVEQMSAEFLSLDGGTVRGGLTVDGALTVHGAFNLEPHA